MTVSREKEMVAVAEYNSRYTGNEMLISETRRLEDDSCISYVTCYGS